MMVPKVSVIILMYNTLSKLGKEFIKKMIESVYYQDYRNLMLVIVDNGSHDKTADYVLKLLNEYSGIEYNVIRLPKNYGYTGGNNRGAVYSINRGTEYLFFMNDDVILLDKNLITVLVKSLETDQKLGAVQPLIINRDGSINCGFRVGLSSIPKVDRHGEKIFYVNGAAFLTRSKLFMKVGMFDPDFFLYHDDVDYAWRLRLLNYRVACIKSVKAYHFGSATVGEESPKYYYFMLRNAVWAITKNSSETAFIPRLSLLLMESTTSFLLHHLLIRRNADLVKADIKGLFNGVKSIKVAISKRKIAQGMRLTPETLINKTMDASIDFELLFPELFRRKLKF